MISCTTASWNRSSRRDCELCQFLTFNPWQRPPEVIWAWMREALMLGRSHSSIREGTREGTSPSPTARGGASFQLGVSSKVRVRFEFPESWRRLNPRRRTTTCPVSSHTSISKTDSVARTGASPVPTRRIHVQPCVGSEPSIESSESAKGTLSTC